MPSSGFAAGGPALPDAARTLEREAPGTHGVPAKPQQPPAQAPVTNTPAPSGWSDGDIKAAQAHCNRVLAGLDARVSFISQVKSGPCGTAAPVELSGFGKHLAISPPIVVTCDIAASLHAWMTAQVQPLAKRHLGAAITQINTMSSYSCRNRYGANNAPLSQHAFANAIDIRGFVTAKGLLLDVEQHWGPTTKELAAYQATLPSVQAPALKGPAIAAISGVKPASWSTAVSSGPAILPAAIESVPGAMLQAKPAGGAQAPAHTASVLAPSPAAAHRVEPKLKATFPVVLKASEEQGTVKIVATGQPALTGPPSIRPGDALDGRAHFLRDVWQGACGPFTTVLGPEANRAHRNHFHVDLAPRKSGAFCQ